MVVPDPPTPSWSRSEDVRCSLNVLDQVLSEFDDPDLDDDFLEDNFDIADDPLSKPTNLKNNSFDAQIHSNTKDQKPRNGSQKFETKAVVHRQQSEMETPPSIDRSKKPKHGPPVLPRKAGSNQTKRTLSDSRDSSKIISKDESLNSCIKSLKSSKEPQGSETQAVAEFSTTQSNETSKKDNNSNIPGESKIENEKQLSGSLKSRSSCGSGSSGTHDYQEINSDICAALQREHQDKLESSNGLQKPDFQRPLPNQNLPKRMLDPHSIHVYEQQQQVHRDAFFQQRHHHKLMQENYNNALRSRGRSVEAKRRSSNGYDHDRSRLNAVRSNGKDGRDKPLMDERSRGRDPSKGRDVSRGRDRSKGRDRPSRTPPPAKIRSKSSDRLVNDRVLDHIRDDYMDDMLRIPPYSDDPRLFEGPFHDPRFVMDGNFDPRLMDPRMDGDPRFIESQMIDPRLYDIGPVMYPMQDGPFPPPLVGYYDSMGPVGPILPPREFGAHPMYPFEGPYLADPTLLTPEEILHLQRGGDPSLILPHPPPMGYDYPSYPMDYALPYPHVPFPIDQEYSYPPNLYPPPVTSSLNVFENSRHVDETKMNIDRLVKGSRHSLAELRPTDGPTPAQLVKELRRSTRNLPPHLRLPTDTPDLSSTYDHTPGGGFRVGEVVHVTQDLRLGVTKPSSTSLPHFSPNTKDSGFDEVVPTEEGSPGGSRSPNEQGNWKAKGSMVVSGVLNSMSNMYIPAPPSPVPDYDDEGGGGTSDGGESDILKGSQFYVVDGGGVAEHPNAKKGKKNGKSAKLEAEKNRKPVKSETENNGKPTKLEAEKNGKPAKLEADKNGKLAKPEAGKNGKPTKFEYHKNQEGQPGEAEKHGSVSKDYAKNIKMCHGNEGETDKRKISDKNNDQKAFVPLELPRSPSVAKAGSPLEKMINKFHENLPPLSALDDAHFSDDSLEDSVADETSTTFTSRPSTIDPKNFWDDSVASCNANDSSTSFDYVKGGYEGKPEKKFNKKLPRTQSQNEAGRDATSKATKPLQKSVSPANKNSGSHSNLSNSPSAMVDLNGKRTSSGNGNHFSNLHRNNSFSVNGQGSSSSVSSDSAKFDTIKNMLRDGLIGGLDDEPPDFVPPPPFLHFENGRRSISEDPESMNTSIENAKNCRRSLSPDDEKLSSFSPSRGSSRKNSSSDAVSKSSNFGKKNKFGVSDKPVSSFSKPKTSPFIRSMSHDRKSPDDKNKLSSSPEIRNTKNVRTNKPSSTAEDSSPPPPPPRESSLTNRGSQSQSSTKRGSQSQSSPGNSSWLHGSRLPSLRNKISRSPSRSPSRKSKELNGSRTSLSQGDPLVEMSEVSIYARSPSDGSKVTHIDGPGDFGGDEDDTDSLVGQDSLEKLKKKEPFRKRTESQPVEKIYDLRKKNSSEKCDRENNKKMNKAVSRQSSEHYHSPCTAAMKKQNRNSIAVDGLCSSQTSPTVREHCAGSREHCAGSREHCGGSSDYSTETGHFISEVEKGLPSSIQIDSRRRQPSPMKRKPPPPPPSSGGATRQIPRSPSRERRNQNSGQNSADGSRWEDENRKSKSSKAYDSTPVLTLPTQTNTSEDACVQDMRRASSLVSSKKGAAPPVPKARTSFPSTAKQQQASTGSCYMPAEGTAEGRSRFSLFKALWRRNKYSLDKT